MSSISSLATNAALTTVTNIIPNISNLVKKTDCETKISEIEQKINDHNHHKYITASDFNKFTTEFFAARLAEANSVTKTDLDKKLISQLTQIKLNMCLLKMKNNKHLIQAILKEKSF